MKQRALIVLLWVAMMLLVATVVIPVFFYIVYGRDVINELHAIVCKLEDDYLK